MMVKIYTALNKEEVNTLLKSDLDAYKVHIK